MLLLSMVLYILDMLFLLVNVGVGALVVVRCLLLLLFDVRC